MSAHTSTCYLSPGEASKILLIRLQDEFGNNGSFDYEKAAEAIYGSADKRHVKDIEFTLAFPICSYHHFLIWDYVGLRVVKVFESNGGITNRDCSQSNREGTEGSGEEISGANPIRPSPQSHAL